MRNSRRVSESRLSQARRLCEFLRSNVSYEICEMNYLESERSDFEEARRNFFGTPVPSPLFPDRASMNFLVEARRSFTLTTVPSRIFQPILYLLISLAAGLSYFSSEFKLLSALYNLDQHRFLFLVHIFVSGS